MVAAAERSRLPEITLRRLDPDRARAVLDGTPRGGDRWAPGYPAEGDREAASLALRTIDLVGETPFGCYEIVLDDGEIVGGAGFHGLPSTDGVVEIGYGVASSRRNRRVATAAIRALVAMASRNGVTCIVARTDPANAPSKRALAAAGFAPATSHDQYDRHELRLEAPDRSVMFGNRRPRASSEATGAEHG